MVFRMSYETTPAPRSAPKSQLVQPITTPLPAPARKAVAPKAAAPKRVRKPTSAKAQAQALFDPALASPKDEAASSRPSMTVVDDGATPHPLAATYAATVDPDAG